MRLWEIIIVSIGVTIDVFAVTICWGAMLAKIDYGWLAKIILIFGGMQTAALVLGQTLVKLPLWRVDTHAIVRLGRGLAIMIWMGLGLYMFFRAHRVHTILESRRGKYAMTYVLPVAFVMNVDALLAGMGMGLLEAPLKISALCFLIITIVSVTVGVFCGYWIGCDQRRNAYRLGGALLLLSGFEVLFMYVL